MRTFGFYRYSLSLLILLFLGCSSNPIKEKSYHPNYLSESYLQTLNFNGLELITVFINDHWYYVRKDGKSMLVIMNDKGKADEFKEGLARTRVNGKIGFFNRSLDMVLEPIYDFAFSFHNGVAEICMGCKEVDTEGQPMLDGGDWKKINRLGYVLE